NGSSGIPDLSFLWRINLSPLPGITFQPSVFSRMLLGGSEVPLAFVNILGAEQTIVEQQIHFPGVHSLVMSERILLGAMFTSQHLIARNQYILLRAAAARHLDDINTFFHSDIDFAGSEFIYGVSVGYAYSSFLGPIQAHIGYSSLAPGVNLYVSIGHLF
ncbi:MAG: hypothetical protein IJ745_05970, partial [Bacteroidales bacterium]|nr:hypothetical protein [Bacteroidales bacterium]